MACQSPELQQVCPLQKGGQPWSPCLPPAIGRCSVSIGAKRACHVVRRHNIWPTLGNYTCGCMHGRSRARLAAMTKP